MRRLPPPPAADLSDDDLAAAYAVPPGRSVRVDFVTSLDGDTVRLPAESAAVLTT